MAGVGLRLVGKVGGEQRVESCNVGQAAALSLRIAPGDLLTHVDGVNVLARPVAPLVLGPEGSVVVLRFLRSGTAVAALEFEVPLVRGSAAFLAQRSGGVQRMAVM
eukprot:2899914-Rhodomonas_salina.1